MEKNILCVLGMHDWELIDTDADPVGVGGFLNKYENTYECRREGCDACKTETKVAF